ncbi:MAG TPA: fibronectin type III domain-containing protein [Steroidobacteraceae bacterium]
MAQFGGSRSVLLLCGAMIAFGALAGCKGGGGGTKVGAASAQEAPAGNSAPKISGSPSTTASPGTVYRFTPVATDPDGDPLSFQIQNKPAWATFNTVTGELSGQPTVGTFANIVISVSDGHATASLPSFTIRVESGAASGTGGGSGSANATLSWIAPTENTDGSPLTNLSGFIVSYGTSRDALSESIRIDNPSVNRYVVDGLQAGKTYYFAVRAVAGDVQGELSEIVSKQM